MNAYNDGWPGSSEMSLELKCSACRRMASGDDVRCAHCGKPVEPGIRVTVADACKSGVAGGDEIEGEVEVRFPGRTSWQGVRLEVASALESHWPDTNHLERHSETELAPAGEYEGEHRWPFRVRVPVAPPTHKGEKVRVVWRLWAAVRPSRGKKTFARGRRFTLLPPAREPDDLQGLQQRFRRTAARTRAGSVFRDLAYAVGTAGLVAFGLLILGFTLARGGPPVRLLQGVALGGGCLVLAALVAWFVLRPAWKRVRGAALPISGSAPTVYLGDELTAPAPSDPALHWQVVWVERAAHRVKRLGRSGGEYYSTEWHTHTVIVGKGTGAVEVRIPESAPAWAHGKWRRIDWELRVFPEHDPEAAWKLPVLVLPCIRPQA